MLFDVYAMHNKGVTAQEEPRPPIPFFLPAVPVLIETTQMERDYWGHALDDALFGRRLVRPVNEQDVESLWRGLRKDERDEFVIVSNLVAAYRHCNDPARASAWREALAAYEKMLSSRRPQNYEPDERVSDSLRACGLDMGTEQATLIWNGYAVAPQAKADSKLLVGEAVGRNLHLAKLVMCKFEDGPGIGLYCPAGKSALYAGLLARLVNNPGLTICEYPHCPKQIFKQVRTNQRYCCSAHRDAHRVMRWRMTPKGQRAMKRDAERRKKRNALARKKKSTHGSKNSR